MVASLFSAIGQAITIYFDLSTAVIGWQAGGLVQVNWKMLAIIGPLIIVGLILAQLSSHQLTILSLNETVAKNLGQRTVLMTLVLLGIVLCSQLLQWHWWVPSHLLGSSFHILSACLQEKLQTALTFNSFCWS